MSARTNESAYDVISLVVNPVAWWASLSLMGGDRSCEVRVVEHCGRPLGLVAGGVVLSSELDRTLITVQGVLVCPVLGGEEILYRNRDRE